MKKSANFIFYNFYIVKSRLNLKKNFIVKLFIIYDF